MTSSQEPAGSNRFSYLLALLEHVALTRPRTTNEVRDAIGERILVLSKESGFSQENYREAFSLRVIGLSAEDFYALVLRSMSDDVSPLRTMIENVSTYADCLQTDAGARPRLDRVLQMLSSDDSARVTLKLVKTAAEVRDGVRAFADGVPGAVDRARNLFVTTNLWVFDPESGSFGPAIFVAFVGMTFPIYEQANKGAWRGARFDGTAHRTGVETALQTQFATNQDLAQRLRAWAPRALGGDPFSGVTTAKWRFVQLPPGNTSIEKRRSMKTWPKCQILFGPPGTGKTYATIERAVEICDGQSAGSRQATRARFDHLREHSQIQLVTFHQSYSYEEFVEGIRPDLQESDVDDLEANEGGSDVRYRVELGIFRSLCSLAEEPDLPAAATGHAEVDLAAATIWKMSLGNSQDSEDDAIFKRCQERGWLLLGYGQGLDFTGCDDRAAVLRKVQTKLPDVDGHDMNVSAVHTFKNVMEVGDLVIVSDGNRKFRALGRIKGPYEYVPEEAYQQARAVEWLVTLPQSLSRERISSKVFSQRTINRPDRGSLKLDAIAELIGANAVPTATAPLAGNPSKNYVLIIDEINRGNISKIFGELITLLEEDKRIGGPEQLRVTLPYSREEFGVPSNVYLIGTMNTADRSIALLDVALRRRFQFEEVMPDPEVLRHPEARCGASGIVGSVDVAALLTRINDRVELLFDRDHQIGHAFFFGVGTLEALRDVFRRKVVPLLQEYFYGDWGKVCMVLGCAVPEDRAAVGRNSHPLIRATRLSAQALVGGDVPDRMRFEVNPDFLAASESELASFFEGIVA